MLLKLPPRTHLCLKLVFLLNTIILISLSLTLKRSVFLMISLLWILKLVLRIINLAFCNLLSLVLKFSIFSLSFYFDLPFLVETWAYSADSEKGYLFQPSSNPSISLSSVMSIVSESFPYWKINNCNNSSNLIYDSLHGIRKEYSTGFFSVTLDDSVFWWIIFCTVRLSKVFKRVSF